MFTVAFVPGVTPGKWAKVWNERFPRERLELRPMSANDARVAMGDGSVEMAFLRLPLAATSGTPDNAADASSADPWHTIPLYDEDIVAVLTKGHPLLANDTLTADELGGIERESEWDSHAFERVAAGLTVAVVPMSVARLHARKDTVSRPMPAEPVSPVGLVWPVAPGATPRADELRQEFIGIVRGRTANSSRGADAEVGGLAKPASAQSSQKPGGTSGGTKSGGSKSGGTKSGAQGGSAASSGRRQPKARSKNPKGRRGR